MIKPEKPSEEQLEYISNLGYDGDKPKTMSEASAILGVLIAKGSNAKAEKAMYKIRSKESESDSEPDTSSCGFIIGSLIIIVLFLKYCT